MDNITPPGDFCGDDEKFIGAEQLSSSSSAPRNHSENESCPKKRGRPPGKQSSSMDKSNIIENSYCSCTRPGETSLVGKEK